MTNSLIEPFFRPSSPIILLEQDVSTYRKQWRKNLFLQVDVLPLERFNAVWRPNEPERLAPVYVERVTIREALRGDLLPSLFGIVQLIEPTFGVRSCISHLLLDPKVLTSHS